MELLVFRAWLALYALAWTQISLSISGVEQLATDAPTSDLVSIITAGMSLGGAILVAIIQTRGRHDQHDAALLRAIARAEAEKAVLERELAERRDGGAAQPGRRHPVDRS